MRAGTSLHPGLASAVASHAGRRRGSARARGCSSARATARARRWRRRWPGSSPDVRAASAGSQPKPLHPNAVRVMRERGIDLAGGRSKHLSEFAGQRFDYVISLCDRVREVCTEFHGRGRSTGASGPGPRARNRRTRPCRPSSARPPSARSASASRSRRSTTPDRFPGGHRARPDEFVRSVTTVDDSRNRVAFYTSHFGFEVRSSAAPAFADVVRGHLRLLLSGPASSAGRPMPDGRRPQPGGRNRIHADALEDLTGEVERLRAAGLSFRECRSSAARATRQIVDDGAHGNQHEPWTPDCSRARARLLARDSPTRH